MKFTTLIATLAFSHFALADLIIPKQLTAEKLVQEIQSIVQAKIEQNLKNSQIQIQVTEQKVEQLPPLSPFMPQFVINGNEVQMKNVFDQDVNKQIQQIQKDMDERIKSHRKKMEQRMKEKFGKQQQLIGGGQHDNWNLQKEHPLVGNHDQTAWMKQTEQHPILGDDQERQEEENEHPMVGRHDQTQWMKQSNYRDKNKEWKHQNKEWKHQNKEWKHQNKIGKHQSKEWKHQQKNRRHQKKQRNGKHDQAWKNRQITAEQVKPYLLETFPAFEGGNIVAVINKGFDMGFNVDIIYQDKDGKQFFIEGVYRPKREELLIKKMEQTPLLLGRNQQSQKKVFQERLQMVPQFIEKNSHHKSKQQLIIPPHFLEKEHAEKQALQEMAIPPQQIEEPILNQRDIMIPVQQIQHPILGKDEFLPVAQHPILNQDRPILIPQHPILGEQGEPQMINTEQLILGKDEVAEKQVMQNNHIEEIQTNDIDEDVQNLQKDELALKKK